MSPVYFGCIGNVTGHTSSAPEVNSFGHYCTEHPAVAQHVRPLNGMSRHCMGRDAAAQGVPPLLRTCCHCSRRAAAARDVPPVRFNFDAVTSILPMQLQCCRGSFNVATAPSTLARHLPHCYGKFDAVMAALKMPW